MTGDGAYGNGMSEVALFENALRAAVPAKPDPMVGVALVPRLAATASAATFETATVEVKAHTNGRPAASPAPARRRRLALVARVAVAVALIPLVLAGLAVAGVHLPQPARDVFHSVGIDLPNQPSADSAQGTDGKRRGNDVSDAAKSGHGAKQGNSAAAHQHARDQHSKARGKAVGHGQGKGIGLNDGTPPGQAKEPAGQSNEPAGQSDTSSGQDKTPPGQSRTPPGQTKAPPGQDNSDAGGNSGEHAAQGVGQDSPLPPQANGNELGHDK